MKNTLLLHACCAPCTAGTLPMLKDFEQICCLWYGPNIHPYTEYKARLDALSAYTRENNLELIVRGGYTVSEFVRNVTGNLKQRCGYCHNIRLGETAKAAKEGGFGAFSSTLLVSPYQNHEMIKETGEKCAKRYGTNFFYGDFRPNFREGQKAAKERGLYMQKYCGCIFSEEERFLQKPY